MDHLMSMPNIANLKAITATIKQTGDISPADTNPVLEVLRCIVCYNIPFTPVHPPHCQHICCSDCFEKWVQHHSNGLKTTCPYCRGEFLISEVVNVLKTTLGAILYGELSIKCPNECGEVIKLGLMRRHLIAECKVRMVRCPFACGSKVVWCKLATQHIYYCAKAYHRCPRCTLPEQNFLPGTTANKHDCLNHALTVIQRKFKFCYYNF